MKIKSFLLFPLLFLIVACDSKNKTTEFCARFYANSTTREEDFAFAENKKLLPELPKRKQYKLDENSVIHGRYDFTENECGLAWFPAYGYHKIKYKKCTPNNYYYKTKNNVGKYCDYLSKNREDEN